MALLFAATWPERMRALVNYGSLPRLVRGPTSLGGSPSSVPARMRGGRRGLGHARSTLVPGPESQARTPTPESIRERARHDRLLISPGALVQLARMNAEIDVRPILPTIRVPTLVLHRHEDHIPTRARAGWPSRSRERGLSSSRRPAHAVYGDWAAVVAAIREFVEPICFESCSPLRQRPRHRPFHRPRRLDGEGGRARRSSLAGAAGAAPRAHPGGARPLPRRRARHCRRRLLRPLRRARPRDPLRLAIREAVRELGLEVRAGVHTGECELVDGKVAGIAVSIGARVAGTGGAGRGAGLTDGQGPGRRLASCSTTEAAEQYVIYPGAGALAISTLFHDGAL